MKNIAFGICLSLIMFDHTSLAQHYWVIETNNHKKDFTIIKFYNEQNEIIYQEKQLGVYLDVSKKRHVKKLDLMLQNYLSSGSLISKKETKRKGNRRF